MRLRRIVVGHRGVSGGRSYNHQRSLLENLGRSVAPGGLVYVDDNHHVWKKVRIGRIKDTGQFSILWESSGLIYPNPHMEIQSKEEWDAFLQNLYDGWNQNWEKQ